MNPSQSDCAMSVKMNSAIEASAVSEFSDGEASAEAATRSFSLSRTETIGTCAAKHRGLPRATSTNDGTEPRCPWCNSDDVGQARIHLGSLNAAWQDFETEWPKRSETGEAECELIADCPACHHPSMVALGSRHEEVGFGRRGERRYIRLVPVRTETDALYLGGGR